MMTSLPSDKRIVLITGGSGFIGRNVIELLSPNYEILAPTSSDLNLIDESAVKAFLSERNVDTVIHLANHDESRNSQKDPRLALQNNLMMFFNLVNCHSSYRRMIYLGSGRGYDQRFYVPSMPEEYLGEHVPVDPYGLSKYIMANWIKGIPNVFELRVFGCFGKYEDWEIKFISYVCCKTLFDQDIMLHQNRRMNYIPVSDLIRVIELFIEKKSLKHQSYNVCSDLNVDLLSVAQRVLACAEKKLRVLIASPEQGKEYSGDNTRFKNEFPEFQFTDLNEAIADLFSWYQQNRQLIDPQLLLLNK